VLSPDEVTVLRLLRRFPETRLFRGASERSVPGIDGKSKLDADFVLEYGSGQEWGV